MLFDQFVLSLLLGSCVLLTASARPFGMKSKGVENEDPSESENENNDNNPLVDLSDEELLDVMEEFALMSEEEREEAFAEVVAMLGDDDPEMIEAVREIMNAVNSLDGEGDGEEPWITESELAAATGMALEVLSTSNWESIYNKRGDILDSLIASGKLTADDAAIFKSNDGAWENELRTIWDGLQSLARLEGEEL
eukprot:CAMPEP_0183756822 /NCGR_PEP_ID=MMETSP0739-20130205/5302_1 /TAXON_ID=385413 /ORGANISM="Thalassiosira miniscula, Strain CCMP1093" /LENGTH=194 /DNA_ID=CAMNT_0025994101 /DNA_START=178 /DNA_END=762 /DNA_ORIENTATION=+